MSEREEGANSIVKKWSLWASGAGLIPIPLVDVAGITGIQIKMLKDLADHYEVPFKEHLGKSALAGIVSSGVGTELGWGSIRSLVKAIPVVGTVAGFVVMPAFAGASTMATGKVFTQHFASGGTFLNFNPDAVREHYQKELAEQTKDESAN
jgi:uncharacterized protein (DUF697 family)